MPELTAGSTQALERILPDAGAPDGAGIRIEYADAPQPSNGDHAEGAG
jgi:hypothetical protein